jgi:hypothetical protein
MGAFLVNQNIYSPCVLLMIQGHSIRNDHWHNTYTPRYNADSAISLPT